MLRNLIILIPALFSVPVVSQTLLYPGDVALVNVNADGDKIFDVLLLKEIAAGTVICFTDDAWMNATQQFRGSEGIMSYTASSGMAAGSVISCPGTAGGNGFVKVSGSFNLSGSGDNIIVFQGSADDPFFLYGTGWARGSTVWEYSESSASYRSDIPPGLSVSDYTIASLGTNDNYCYSSSSVTTGTPDELLSSIATPANWNSDNATAFSAISFGFTITPDISTISTPSTLSTLTPHHTSLYLTSSLSITGSVTCQSITIAPGGSLNIQPGGCLRVFGEIDNQRNIHGLTIHSDITGSGSLIHSAPDVPAVVQRYISPDQWHFVSIPVSNPADINSVFATPADHLHGIYYYDETAGEWTSALGLATDPGRGYNVFYSDVGRTITFIGTLNDHRTRSWVPVTRSGGSGWNLIGNPFPCSLNWGTADLADAPGWKNQATALEHKTIYITTGGSGESTTFDTYNGSSGIGVPDNSVGIVAPGQAFWIRAAASDSLGVGCYAKCETTGTFKAKDRGTERLRDQGTERLRDQGTERLRDQGTERLRDQGTERPSDLGNGIPAEARTVSPQARMPVSPYAHKPSSPYALVPLCPDAFVSSNQVPSAPRLKSGVSHTPQAIMSIFRFAITSLSTGQSDQIVVTFDDRAECGFDRFDSKKMLSTGNNFLQWYINADENPMVIVALPCTSPTGYTRTNTLPLTVILPDDGYYEITTESSIPDYRDLRFAPTSSTFSTDNINSVSFSFILEDRLTGVRQLMRPDQPYVFSAGAGVLENRFFLIANGLVDEVEEVYRVDRVEEVEVVYSQGQLNVKSSLDPMHYPANFRLFNDRGQCILSSNLSETDQSFSLPGPVAGINYWTIITDNSRYSGKLLIIR